MFKAASMAPVPIQDKSVYHYKHCGDSHQRLSPDQLFKDDPDLNIRQLINRYVIKALKSGKKLVLDDDFRTRSKRESYLALIKKKVPGIQCGCIQFYPAYGVEQLQWSRELHLAECVERGKLEQAENWAKVRPDLWLNSAEPPQVDEGMHIQEVGNTLELQLSYKLEVPALFIQWEGLVRYHDSEANLVKGSIEAVHLWYDNNPCGRVIVIHDGVTTPGVPSGEKVVQVHHILKEFTKELRECPVYLLMIDDCQASGAYSVPPSPGLVAFLQRLHYLDLQSRATMYLYDTVNHMRLAERAGIKHIKASRVFSYPKLAKSSHAATSAEVPEMLNKLSCIPPITQDWRLGEPSVPLYDEALQSLVSLGVCRLPFGRSLYLCARDAEVLQRYHNLYAEKATRIGESPSKIPALGKQISNSLTPHASTAGNNLLPRTISTSSTTSERSRDLPKWMMPKTKSETLSKSVQGKDSSSLKESSTCSKVKSKSTTYVLSEEELVETAMLILQESGTSIPSDEEIATQHSLRLEAQAGRSQAAISPESGIAEGQPSKIKVRTEPETKARGALDELLDDFDTNVEGGRRPGKTEMRMSDYRVPDTSSLGSPGSRKPCVVVNTSLVEESKSLVNIPPLAKSSLAAVDSFVSDTGKSSGMSSAARRGSHTAANDTFAVPNSLVPSTINLKDKKLSNNHTHPRSATVIADSLVQNTNPCPLLSRAQTGTFGLAGAAGKRRVTDGELIPDSLVPETINTVAETASLGQGRTKAGVSAMNKACSKDLPSKNREGRQSGRKREHSPEVGTLLDGLI